MANLYLVPAGSLALAERGTLAVFDGSEARHAVTVARLKVGEELALADGEGVRVHGVVSDIDASPSGPRVTIIVRERNVVPDPSPTLWLAQALAKGDRDERAAQAATELGVDGVIPWSAERSIVRWDASKAERNLERWRGIVREASKQSMRARIPTVDVVHSTSELAARTSGEVALWVLDPTASESIATVGLPTSGSVVLVVGPEGGISEREFSVFEQAGARRVRLGAEVLRTSTAGPAALAALSVRLGRWSVAG